MNRLTCIVLSLFAFVALQAGAETLSGRIEVSSERAYSAFSRDPHRQFDFWIGVWDVNLRMLQEDLSFRDSVLARASIYSILDGKAILELWDSESIKGYSLRYYDPAKGKWVLWLDWPSPNRSNKSSLEGDFRHGRGNFETSFTNQEGQEMHGRYSFNDITPFSLRWDDLWSKDGGKSWAKNWRMEWTRRAVNPRWPIDRRAVPTFDTGGRCDDEAFRPYEKLVGSWRGDGTALEAYRVLDGCAVMGFFDAGEESEFLIFTWVGAKSRWEVDVLDHRRDSPLVTYSGTGGWHEMSSADGKSISFATSEGTLTYRRGARIHSLAPVDLSAATDPARQALRSPARSR